jgi:F0F1-type ATP synthase beta subunit
MKEKYPFFNNSNLFLRDIQYGVKHFFEMKNIKLAYKRVEDIIKGFKGLINGEYDDLPEGAFMYVGTIEEAVEKAKKMR